MHVCWIKTGLINVCRSIGYIIGAPKQLYKNNQSTIKQVPVNRITPQARYINILITDLHKYHLRQTFVTVDTISNTQLDDLNYKTQEVQILIYLVDQFICACFYLSSVSENHTPLHLDQLHNYTHRKMPSDGKSNKNQYDV